MFLAHERTVGALLLSALATWSACANPYGLPPPSSRPDPLTLTTALQRYALPNGLTVILNEDQRIPAVVVRVVHPVGESDDPPEAPGMAHLVEHLLFRGSRHVEDRQHSAYLLAAGASEVNGTTSPDQTDLYELIPSAELTPALFLEADRMAFGLERISQADLDAEKRILALEREQRIEDVAGGRVSELIRERLFGRRHPYYPRADDLGAVTLDDVRAFFKAFYGPNDAVLVVSGAIDPPSGQKVVAHYFGSILPFDRPGAPPPRGEIATKGGRLEVEARVDEAHVALSWVTPSEFTREATEFDVLASHLTWGPLQKLRRRGLATTVGAGQSSWRLASLFQIDADVAPGIDPDIVVAELEGVLDGLKQEPMSQQVVANVARGWASAAYLGHDDLSARSWELGHAEIGDSDPRFLLRQKQRYQKVTGSALNLSMVVHLSSARRLVTVVRPNAAAPLAGRVVLEQ